MRKLLLAVALACIGTAGFAHGVQVVYRVLPSGFIRIYVEHWHGDQTAGSLVNNGMSITTTYGTTTITQNLNPTGAVNNTAWNNLPGGGSALTVLRTCSGEANRYNDWAYYDFAPAACGIPISITLNQGNTVVLEEACSGLYPVTINATFNDNSGPVLTCPSPIANVPCGSAGTNVNFAATAVDNCGVQSISYSIAPGSFFPVGTTNVTATATDVNGFTSQCTFPVTVRVTDNTAPEVTCPQDVTLDADAATCGAVYQYAIPFSDNCGTASITQLSGIASGGVFPVGTTTNSFRISDPSGNSTLCSFKVTVRDQQAPKAVAKNISIALSAAGTAGIDASSIDGGSSDNCGISSSAITAGRTSFSCADAGQTFAVTLTVTDNVGLTDVATAMVTITDPLSVCNKAPIALCRPRTITANLSCQGTPTAAIFNNGSSDPDGDAISFSISPAGPFNLGTTQVIFTVTDARGASSSCSTTVTVVDGTPPLVTAPAPVTVNAAPGQCSVTGINLGTATAVDNCGVVTSISNEAPATFPVGTTAVMWLATDNAGRVGIAYQKVTVVSTTPPVISAVAAISVNNDAARCAATVAVTSPTAIAGCTVSECISENMDNMADGAVSGQSSKWLPWPGGTSGIVSSAAAFSGTKSIQFSNSQDQLYLLGDKSTGKWTARWKMYVPAGSTAYYNIQHYAVAGTEWGQQVQFSSNGVAVLQTGGTFTQFTYPQGQWFSVEQYFDLDNDQTSLSIDGNVIKTWPASWQAQGINGTRQLGSFDFFAHTGTLAGIEPNPAAPSLFYIDDMYFCGGDNAVVEGTRSDGQALVAAYPVGTTTITWTATDLRGLVSTSNQAVTVTDNEAPVVNCGSSSASRTVDNAGCTYLVKGTEFDITASDNCGVASIVNSYNGQSSLNGASLAEGTHAITWTVTDIHGNHNTCIKTVTVTNAFTAAITGSSVLSQGVNQNTIYIGYGPASTLSLTATGAGSGSGQYSYQWSTSNNLAIVGSANNALVKITASSAGSSQAYTATVVITDGYGCVKTTSFAVNVVDVRCGNKNDKVLVCHKTSSGYVQICIAPSAVATHLANGSYLGNCAAARGGNEIPVVKAAALKAYPNPTNGVFELRLLNFTPGKYQVQVMDLNGKLVASKLVTTSYSTEDVRFDLREQASATYYVRIMNGNEVVTTQVVVAR